MLSLLPLLLLQGEMPVAVLQSGTRVEAKEVPTVGDRRVETAYGRYDASLDPVVEVVDGRADLQLLEPLAEMDRTAWLARVSERGLLSTLVDATPEDAATRAAWLDALTAWGGKLDTLPSRTDRDQRSERLWQALLRADDAEQALLTGALLREIPESRDLPKRRIGLVDLRRALESKDPEVRRAAALVAAHQRTNDLVRPLLDRSLEDEGGAVRTAAAEALVSLDEEKALGLWTLSLWRGKAGDLREQAADHLGDFGSREPAVIKALIHALAPTSGGAAPRSHAFFGRQVSYVSDFDVEVAAGAVIADPVVSVLTEGAVLEIRVISTTLASRIRGSLTRLTGQDFGTDRDAWARWYEKTYPQP